jgi:hypothetical protein
MRSGVMRASANAIRIARAGLSRDGFGSVMCRGVGMTGSLRSFTPLRCSWLCAARRPAWESVVRQVEATWPTWSALHKLGAPEQLS